MKMTSKDLDDFKNNILDIYGSILPYTAKNGVYFRDNGVLGLFGNGGFVRPSNGYLGKDSYYPILQHEASASDGSTTYLCQISCVDLGIEDLELLSIAIENKVVELCEKQLK